ncbi:hypothetical protein M413DRAFT_446010 [Hebeloma cylindrosporum]|uniref:Uncharacterized protein n=1 Tax=Hebeloma cylindrosporum TaxID=76867 RepID=A0A0C3CAF1_HEBCY|nr:hypothetical protein M413DRAFT_446010 [Hebeloma cylindrosporum h7]
MTSTTTHSQASAESSGEGTSHTAFASEPDMPAQRHAGKVGLGPNYHAGPTLEDKVVGVKEEVLGKITHKPERIQHGHEVLTGEERRKKLTGEDEPNPFQDKSGDEEEQDQESIGSQTGMQSRISDTGGTRPGKDHAEVERAASVAPESSPKKDSE